MPALQNKTHTLGKKPPRQTASARSEAQEHVIFVCSRLYVLSVLHLFNLHLLRGLALVRGFRWILFIFYFMYLSGGCDSYGVMISMKKASWFFGLSRLLVCEL